MSEHTQPSSEAAEELLRLDAVTESPEHRAAALRAAVMFAASGMTPEQLEVFVKITTTARVTNEDIVQLARRGIRIRTETYLEDELVRLRAWKAEALPVIAGLQDLGRALGIRLGESITGRTATDAALDLRNERDAARAAHQQLTDVLRGLVRPRHISSHNVEAPIERMTNGRIAVVLRDLADDYGDDLAAANGCEEEGDE